MLRISKISFPGFGIGEFSVNSVAFELFGLEIAWYAVIISLGMVLAVIYTMYRGKQIGITTDDVIDYALFAIPIGIIGARLYYVVTTPGNYHSFLDVINIRNGGLAIYGGIIAGVLTVLVVSYVKKIKFFAMADCAAPALILAQGIGRWGNFMNGEAFGYETDWFCRMGLQNDLTKNVLMYVHPTFLYESLWNILGFAIAASIHKYRKYDGQILLFVFAWYGFGRFFIEGLRTDSLYIPGTSIRISQMLGAIIFLITLGLLIYFTIRKPTSPLYVKQVKKQEKKNGKNN